MSKYFKSIIKKGRHFSLPLTFKRSHKLKYEVEFQASCRYDHGDADQQDWNKLCGLKRNFFKPHNHTCMVVWRYNKNTDRIDLSYYQHDNVLYSDKPLNRLLPKELMASVEIGKPVTVQIDSFLHHWQVKMQHFQNGRLIHVSKTLDRAHRNIFESFWYIRNWFGGNKPAPHTMVIGFKDLLK